MRGEANSLAVFWQHQDEHYFVSHPDRLSHIRTAYTGECELEFQSLGDHEPKRRRIVLTRADFTGKVFPDNRVLKLPMIAYADETIEDRDDVLLPMIRDIMTAAATKQGWFE